MKTGFCFLVKPWGSLIDVGVGGSGCGVHVAATASPAGGGAVVAAPATEEKKYEPTGDSDGDLRFGLILA